jgi:hypothetical protein
LTHAQIATLGRYDRRNVNFVLGNFDLQDMDEQTFNALMQGYPIMSATDDEIG